MLAMNNIEAMSNNGQLAKYEITRLSPVDPLSAVETLVQKDFTKFYWIYGSDNETKVALDPIGEVVVTDNRVQSIWDGEVVADETATDPFEQVGRLLNAMPIEEWRAFGHVAFDAAGFYYPYPFRTPTAQMRFIIPKTELLISGKEMTVRTLEDPEAIISALKDVKSFSHPEPNVPTSDPSDREVYERKVAKLTKYIRAGELTKAILSRCVKLPESIDIFSTFAAIRRDNPAARTYCFYQQDLSGIGSSPELLMETTSDGLIRTTPLAGTRPRGKNAQEDENYQKELATDAKEVKEHVMSVQLAKEELESICRLGSVSIKPFMEIAPFRTVQHLLSSVSGRLIAGLTLWDGLRALFPGVTVSGIDKQSAIEKVAELERRARGAYAGCVGWVDSSGTSDFAISLRSAFEDANGATMSAGAGIIAESIPEREYQETELKMRTIQTELVLHNR